MTKNTLWTGVYDLSGKEIRRDNVGTVTSWAGDNYPYFNYNFNVMGEDLVQVSWGLYLVLLVDDLPFELPKSFFQEMLEMKIYCHLSLKNAYGNIFCNVDYRKEAGKSLIRLQNVLAEYGLLWRTLWEHNFVPVSLSTAKRYKALARK